MGEFLHDILSSMYLQYFYWQYVAAPAFLLRFFWTVQQSLLQIFSVRLMLRTLAAHWRRDQVTLRQSSITGIVVALAQNAISRVVGFLVRSAVLLLWLVSEIVFLIFAVGSTVLFLVALPLALGSIVYGFLLLFA